MAMSALGPFPFPIPSRRQFYDSNPCEMNWNPMPPVDPYCWTRAPGIGQASRLLIAPYRFPFAPPVAPDVMRSIQAQNERLVKDGILYDATAIFQQIFTTNGLTERFALVNETEVALWLLTEQDYRHFYRELHAFVIPANPAQDLACDLVKVDTFLANQVQNDTLFRDGEVPLGNMRISIADLRSTTDDSDTDSD